MQYNNFGEKEYIFTTIAKMVAKADELVFHSKLVPKKIIVEY